MGGLSKKQQQFTRAYPLLMLYAQYHGYELTDGDAYRDKRCHYGLDNSNHRVRLARDFNVFQDGNYLTGEEAKKAHRFLHDFWDLMDGAERIENDLNHYSFEHNGVR